MTGFFLATRRVLCALTLVAANAAMAQDVFIAQCKGRIVGYPVTGQISVEYLITFSTYRHYGSFRDTQGNTLEMEVNSNQNGGVGSVWLNGARHRETQVELQYDGNQVFIRELHGPGRGQLTCN